MTEYVVLVDENDNQLGLMEKQQAHIAGLLHRAFSVFVFNSEGETLLQKRAEGKYHSPGLWTNTCCSHPRENETYIQAAQRRIQEEMGFSCELEEKFHFIYKAKLDNDLYEHELDRVFTGIYNGEIQVNPEEVSDYKWISMENLIEDMNSNPENYTIWFKIIFKEYLAKLQYESYNQ
ncbi:isopentenyl-diphosphate Delta-isomerase [Moheibacter sediminis]|uniref:Isopentenyl-diphosphate delta-isomerase n=1 Tax=Moheibacter sediminis TaxID=1434700 RepID=A0A1W2AII8_9FLAO|nr:isopentenyl-diphosphate Delta-isomerase [Moheibacter sediminis]SMC60496.1 isopentenyl-diphosphate delta-isomerase [Moheibacter sediminis]